MEPVYGFSVQLHGITIATSCQILCILGIGHEHDGHIFRETRDYSGLQDAYDRSSSQATHEACLPIHREMKYNVFFELS